MLHCWVQNPKEATLIALFGEASGTVGSPMAINKGQAELARLAAHGRRGHMARTLAMLPAGSRITDYISLGVIAKFFPLEKIREVLQETNRASKRERDLPAHVVMYY